jgi:hypothetical protein
VHDAVARVVHVGRLRRQPVQLDDAEFACPERFDRRRAHVVAAEVEAGKAAAQTIDGGFECGRRQRGSIEKERSARVRADLDERHHLARCGHARK